MSEKSSYRHMSRRQRAAALAGLGAAALLPLCAQPARAAAPAAPAGPPATLPALAALGVPADAPTRAPARAHSVWDDLAMCESSGDWHINSGNGFYGGLQFWQPTWKQFGGQKYARRADLATPAQQIAIAEAVLRVQGWKAWPVCSKRLGLTGHKKQQAHPAHPAATAHTVRPGETLAGIARAQHVSGGWSTLYSRNKSAVGPDPDLLRPGTVLTLG
jgi:nucleoid-associated protein YgaU